MNYLFINLIPQEGKLSLIIGYNIHKVDSWIIDYVESWKILHRDQFGLKLTELLATKIETWAISPDFFARLDINNVKAFIDYWNSHAINLRTSQEVDFNLFA